MFVAPRSPRLTYLSICTGWFIWSRKTIKSFAVLKFVILFSFLGNVNKRLFVARWVTLYAGIEYSTPLLPY